MKFAIEHAFTGIRAAEYAALFFDEAFASAAYEAVMVERVLLRLDRAPDRIVRHIRCVPAREIPGAITQVLGGERFAYVEQLDYDVARRRGHWRTISSIAASKIDASGTIAFDDSSVGAKRIVVGEIKVGMFGIGGIVERFAVGEVEKSYSKSAAFTTRWLAARRAFGALALADSSSR